MKAIAQEPLTVVVTILVTLLLGCNSDASSVFSGSEPGQYLAVAEYTNDNGWAPFLFVEVSPDSTVRDIVFDYTDAESLRRNELQSESDGDAVETYLMNVQSLPLILEEETPQELREQLTWFNAALPALLHRMEEGDERPVLVPTAGTEYTAEDAPDGDDCVGEIFIRVEGRTITDVTYDEFRRTNGTEDVLRKSTDPDYAKAWKSADDHTPERVFRRLELQLAEEGDPSGVDIVSGATRSSRRFRHLADAALAKRVPVDFANLRKALTTE